MQEFQRPQKPSFNKQKDDGMFETAREEDSRNASEASKRSRSVSQDSQGVLDDMDDLLSDDQGGEREDNGADSPNELDEAENNPDDQSDASDEDLDADEAGLFNDEEDTQSEGKGKQSLRARIGNQKKWLFLGASSGALALLGVVMALVLFSGLKLPNLAENITTYQFTRVMREYAKSSHNVSQERLAIQAAEATDDTATKGLVQRLQQRAANGAQKVPGVKGFWDNYNKLSPAQVSRNVLRDTKLKPIYAENRLGINKLTGYSINGQKVLYEAPKGVGRFVPFWKDYLQLKSNQSLINQLQPLIEQSEGLRDVNSVTRGFAMNRIYKRLGFSRIAWVTSKFTADSDSKKALRELNRQTNTSVAEQKTVPGDLAATNDATEKAATASKDCIADDKCLDEMGRSQTGVAEKVPGEIAKVSVEGGFSKATRFISGPVYNVAFVACTFIEAAHANDTIDAGNDTNERTFAHLNAASSTLKRGPSSNAETGAFDNALSAANDKAGDNTEDSIPMLRSNNRTVDTSTAGIPAQSSALGYQSLKATLDNDILFATINKLNGSCGVITNPITATGTALANLALSFASGGELSGIEGSFSVTVSTITKRITDDVVKKFTTTFAKENLLKLPVKTTRLLSGVATNAGVVVGASLLGAMVGASHAPNATNTGVEGGNDWIDTADAGGNAFANEMCQSSQFCRPLTKEEFCYNQQADIAFREDSVQSQSSFQRYFATSNSQSLMSRTVVTVGSTFSGPISKPLVNLGTYITKPGSLFGSLLSPFGGKTSAAMAVATNCDADSSSYGNTQFGWSKDEDDLLDLQSYQPAMNLAILADSGRATDIANKYAKCFGYKVNGEDLEPDEKATLGNLLAEGDTPAIVRDAHGNVINGGGDCDPDKLSYNSSDPLASDGSPDSPNSQDMIFRWRLANRYANSNNQLLSIQNASSQDNSETSQ